MKRVKWKATTRGWLKLNVDAVTFSSSNYTRIVGVIGDHLGSYMAAKSRLFYGLFDPFETEALEFMKPWVGWMKIFSFI